MKIRFARHTHDLEIIKNFYCKLIGLHQTGHFKNHEGYDGIFLSYPGESWELEFTVSRDQPKNVPDEDDMIIIYPSEEVFEQICSRLTDANKFPIEPKNLYWEIHGVTYLDPDGFRIVIAKGNVFQ